MWHAGLLDKIGKHGSLAIESITKIDFRDIRHGWNDYGFSISGKSKPGQADNVLFYERRVNNLFMRGFLADLYLRPSCHECPAKWKNPVITRQSRQIQPWCAMPGVRNKQIFSCAHSRKKGYNACRQFYHG